MLRRATACLSVIACTSAIGGIAAPSAGADRPGGLFDVYSLAIAPDGGHVYAGQGLGSPYAVLSRDPSTSRLQYLTKSIFPGAGASAGGEFRRTIAVSPDSKDVYDSLNGSNALRHMRAVDGTVLFGGNYVNYVGGIVGLANPGQVAVSPDGRCVYVTTTGVSSGSIVAFRRDAGGELSFADTFTSGPEQYTTWGEMAVSSDGRRLYSVGAIGVGVFSRDQTTCALELSSFESAPFAQQLTGLALASDDRTLYSIDPYSSRLNVADVDPETGTPSPLQSLAGGSGGVAGLDGVNGVVVSPDGEHVYTSAGVENAVAAFTRASDGRLTFQRVWRDGEHGIVGLARASSLVISADGRSVYASSPGIGGAVVAFARDQSTGDLTYAGTTTEADGPSGQPIGPGGPGPGGPGPGGPGVPVPVPPVPPAPTGNGHVGVSINGGARYTNSPQVRVSVVWPVGASNLLISNDGGFGKSRTFSVSRSVAWRLDSSGPERLPKTIYARFDGSSQTFQDDIILDETAPRVTSATLAPQATPRASSSKKPRRRGKSFRVTVKASDKTSGVGHVQVTANKRKPGRLLKHQRRLTVTTTGTQPRYIRAQDRAGNYSTWYRLKAPKRTAK